MQLFLLVAEQLFPSHCDVETIWQRSLKLAFVSFTKVQYNGFHFTIIIGKLINVYNTLCFGFGSNIQPLNTELTTIIIEWLSMELWIIVLSFSLSHSILGGSLLSTLCIKYNSYILNWYFAMPDNKAIGLIYFYLFAIHWIHFNVCGAFTMSVSLHLFIIIFLFSSRTTYDLMQFNFHSLELFTSRSA